MTKGSIDKKINIEENIFETLPGRRKVLKEFLKERPEWICVDCAKKHNLKHGDNIETFHIGKCDVCEEQPKEVGPARYYRYPVILIGDKKNASKEKQ